MSKYINAKNANIERNEMYLRKSILYIVSRYLNKKRIIIIIYTFANQSLIVSRAARTHIATATVYIISYVLLVVVILIHVTLVTCAIINIFIICFLIIKSQSISHTCFQMHDFLINHLVPTFSQSIMFLILSRRVEGSYWHGIPILNECINIHDALT